MNRSGLGIHFTIEKFYPNKVALPTGTVYSEAMAAATKSAEPKKSAGHSRKALIIAALGLMQALIVVLNEVFDIVDSLNLV